MVLLGVSSARSGGDIYLSLTHKPLLKGLSKDFTISDKATSAIEKINGEIGVEYCSRICPATRTRAAYATSTR